jgi:hypothetical protein
MADKALLLGINTYKSVNQLRGCENDVRGMSELLTQVFHFEPSNIKTLLNQKVTKAEVTRQLRWLFKDVGEGDQVVMHFSGHGSYMPDDEGQGVDVLICLYDMDWDNPNSYVKDKELREWTKELPEGANLTVILDNCHSGAGTRMIVPLDASLEEGALIHVGATLARALAALPGRVSALATRDLASVADALHPDNPHAVVVRFLPPPPEIQRRAAQLQVRRSLTHGSSEETMNHILLAACREDQTSADAKIDNDYHGAFTYYLCQTATAGGPARDRNEVIDQIKQSLAREHFDQEPQLEGPSAFKHGPLFARPVGNQPDPRRTEPNKPSSAPSAVDRPPDDSQRALLELLNKLLDTFQAARAEQVRPDSRALATRQLVYVHGICRHVAGYSNDWWKAMSPYTPSLQPGALDGNRHEVLWSDVIAARAIAAPAVAQKELRDRLVATLADRIERNALAAAPTATTRADARALVAGRGLPGLPDLNCIDDFTVYLLNNGIRRQVIDRFVSVVKPLLQAGSQVEVISHSWGTVVAYEALRLMDADGGLPSSGILNFFTVGSALSIFEVKHLLLPEAIDGRRPRLVARWINLNARDDVVGGRMQDNPFQVDEEFLNLDPVGCPAFLGLASPVCAHGSYFNAANLTVNRDIFGDYIES